MTNKELEGLLSRKEASPARQNVSLVLSPDVTRNSMRLKKLRHDRRQAVFCALAGLVFLLAAGGVIYFTTVSENPQLLLRPALISAATGMLLTLLLAPALAWFTDEERKNEA